MTGNPMFLSSRSYFESLSTVLSCVPHDTVDAIGEKLYSCFEEGRTLFLMGNGGSAALASHLACDLGKGVTECASTDKRLRVIALNDNIPLMTAWANDRSYEEVFMEQLRNLLQPGDLVFSISGSGNSKNVLKALQFARDAGAFIIGLGGNAGGKMKALCDICLVVPSDNMQHIEDLHLCIGHSLFSTLRSRVSLSESVCGAGASRDRFGR